MSSRVIKVWVDIGPQHFQPGASSPAICRDEPDFYQKHDERRFVAEVLLQDESMLRGTSTSINGEMERAKDDLFGGKR